MEYFNGLGGLEGVFGGIQRSTAQSTSALSSPHSENVLCTLTGGQSVLDEFARIPGINSGPGP